MGNERRLKEIGAKLYFGFIHFMCTLSIFGIYYFSNIKYSSLGIIIWLLFFVRSFFKLLGLIKIKRKARDKGLLITEYTEQLEEDNSK